MTDSLFTGANADDNNSDAPQIDPNKNYVEELVGEGKKFKTIEDLARSVLHKDHFIERLKGETEGLRTELNTRLTLEQYLDKMGSNVNQQNQGRSDQPLNEPNGADPDTKSLKPEDIEALIEKKVSEREQQRIQSQNLAEVKSKLTEAFGNDFPSKLKEVGASLGLSEERLNAMAAESPKAFLKLVGADAAKPSTQPQNSLFTPPPSNTVRQPSAPTGERTKKFYDELKRRDPKEYWTPAVQNQLHKDALRLGRDFFDT